MPNPVLEAKREQRAAGLKYLAELGGPESTAAKEARGLNEDEARNFDYVEAEVRNIDEEIAGLVRAEERAATAATASAEIESRSNVAPVGDGVIRSEPHTYDAYGPNSYFRDMGWIAAAQLDSGANANAPDALRRIQQHGQEIEREARTDKRIAAALYGVRGDLARRGAIGDFEKRVNPNTTAGTGGEFVPPLWDEQKYAPYLRAGRTFANRVTNLPLPPGIDVINIPKITTGSLTGPQTANAAPVISQDIKTTVATANVLTIAGQEDISMQLLEQSPLALDGVIHEDLNADYDKQLDTLILIGSGSNGQHLGIFNIANASVSANTPNSANITVVNCQSADFVNATGSQFSSIVSAVTSIETLTFSKYPPTAVWTHPRRANSWAFAVDSQTTGVGRPYMTAPMYGPLNALGSDAGDERVPEGMAGTIFGLPVIKDANFPTTASSTGAVTFPTGSSTYDGVIVLNESVPLLYEGTPRYRALPEILSGTLQIRFQVYCYSAFLPTRFPTAIALLYGTGMNAPTF